MNKITKHICKQVRERRKALGFRQAAFADYLQISRTQYCNFEIGRSGTTFEKLYHICCALHCQVSDLFPPVIPIKTKTVDVVRTVIIKKKLVKGKKTTII